MSFYELVLVINTVFLALCFIGAVIEIVKSITGVDKKVAKIYSDNLLLLRILQKAEKIIREKGTDSLSSEDIFDAYCFLSFKGASETEIDEELKNTVELKAFCKDDK